MPLLWNQREHKEQWSPVPLGDEDVALPLDPDPPVGGSGPAAAVITRPVPGGGPARTLMAAPGGLVWVNGEPLILGIRVLCDRDTIRIGARECVFYSTESLPQIVPFPEARPVPCARCKTDIMPGTPAVRCPSLTCNAWHHQSDDLPCWTYAEKCAGACDQSTAMDGHYRWNPEGI